MSNVTQSDSSSRVTYQSLSTEKYQNLQMNNDEIDLKELFVVLWAGKVWILGITLLFAVGVTVFSLRQPSVYESKAVLVIDADPYSIGVNIGPQGNHALRIIAGKEAIIRIQKMTDVPISRLNISSTGDIITVSQQGLNPSLIFSNVQVFTENINKVLVELELDKAELALVPLKSLINTTDSPTVKEVLAEKYAEQLYKIALLKSPSTELARVTQEPVEATSHVKSKRMRNILFGTLLGSMLGGVLVLIVFMFRKKE
ncbi:Wzz/FepE/Etk N-terminal domain-containing protein [Vibrio sp. DW001]|uniref:Wzz/FepE/Etk N-terminal domain-containing protein n=1 Tax=Vibrio sp. DW001 TaxID=2912315 RepID=UPI0023AF550C|nr:Wzz/FepE/Etk N-terminal domain-containing protein [Vibrio sp. DW001]WED26862.1 Wzz/FepE/Etk N-terminal domain-containing protein [Vibrio sp. DW001]